MKVKERMRVNPCCFQNRKNTRREKLLDRRVNFHEQTGLKHALRATTLPQTKLGANSKWLKDIGISEDTEAKLNFTAVSIGQYD